MRDAMTEQALVLRLEDDLVAAFPELVDTYGPMVLTMAARLTDETTGQDITQDVFLRAYQALATYEPSRIRELEPRPWLATITRNLVRNEYRRRSRKGTVPLNRSADGATHQAEEDVRTVDDRDQLSRLLGELTDVQSDAVVLRHVLGLPMREVALTLACPEGTAKSHVSRGIGRLRELIAETPDTEGGTP